MQSDLGVYKSSLEQQNHSNSQLREKLTRDKNELEEVWYSWKKTNNLNNFFRYFLM